MSRRPGPGAPGAEGIIPDICPLKQEKGFSAPQFVKLKSELGRAAAASGGCEQASAPRWNTDNRALFFFWLVFVSH